jgi:uncharacterized protein YuzE
MKYTVVGIGQRLSGTSKSNGKPYDFTSLYCLCTSPDVTGEKAEDVSFSHLSNLTFPNIGIGDIINVDYDKRGYMVGIDVLEKAVVKSNVKFNTQQT